MRVLFWGTPEFAAPALRALIGEAFEVIGVVTQPDKPRGRRRTVTPPPIKVIALEEGLPCFQPERPRDPEFREMLATMKPEISVVVAYGHILPQDVIDASEHGTLNIHASLLPLLRGAAPIQAAIRQGFRETGITIMRMVRALDAGPVILQMPTPILADETYGELQLRLSELGALAIVEALTLISLGAATETPQDDSLATYAGKITREDARIVWSHPATEVANAIRAYDPTPGAYTMLADAEVKLFGARVANGTAPPGTVISADDDLVIACGTDALRILQVQPSGRGRMGAGDWVRGRAAVEGDIFR